MTDSSPGNVLGALPALLLVLLGLAWAAPDADHRFSFATTDSGKAPTISWEDRGQGVARILTSDGSDVWVSTHGDGDYARRGASGSRVSAHLSQSVADRRMCVPTSLRWSHPRLGLPHADVVIAGAVNGSGEAGPLAMQTRWDADHGRLPVLSLVARDEDFFGAELGLMVAGYTMLDPPVELAQAYAQDPVFWKYPGNYHQRGKAWERRGMAQLLMPDGAERWQRSVAIRINGQQTRGLAQHSIRVLFDDVLVDTLFGEGSSGMGALVVRAAGNDQVKAMMRDAYQHGLCRNLPFDVAPALPVVLYLNGAYWGVHHIRPRMDDRELARRIGARPKDITIVEDQGVLYRGSAGSAIEFKRMIAEAERGDASDLTWVEELDARLDVEEYLIYMAAQMILGNMDWPKQNIRFWRYEKGQPGAGRGDGRWHMAMGDSDLGFGAIAGPEDDLFRQLRPKDAPASRLLMALLRVKPVRERFAQAALDLLDAELSSSTSSAELERMAALLAPEMQRHTDRWRKPSTLAEWEREVGIMRRFAAEREQHARAHIAAFLNNPGH